MSLFTSSFLGYTDHNLGDYLKLGESFTLDVFLRMWGKGLNTPIYYVYWGIITMLFMSYCAAAYVIYQTVQAGISFTEGFYHIYADYSEFGNLMYLWEVLTIAALILWSFVIIILSSVAGGQLWELIDARVAEAATTVAGDETPLTWDKGMRNFFLAIIAGFGAMISASALGETAYELVGYFDGYDDKTNNECTPSGCSDTAGTSAQNDLITHLVTVFYGIFALSAISFGGYIFMMSHVGFDDDFDCEFVDGIDQSQYAALWPAVLSMRGYDDCMAGIHLAFPLLDLNNDGFVTRCEDAQFQYVMGETREYALKFSAAFTPGGLSKVCGKLFPYF